MTPDVAKLWGTILRVLRDESDGHKILLTEAMRHDLDDIVPPVKRAALAVLEESVRALLRNIATNGPESKVERVAVLLREDGYIKRLLDELDCEDVADVN